MDLTDEQLTHELAEIADLLRLRQKLERDVLESDRYARRLGHELADIDRALADAEDDLRAIDGVSVDALLAWIAGTREAKTAEERARVSRLLLKRTQVADAEKNARRVAEDCQRRIDRLNQLESRRQKLMEHKAKRLQQDDGELGRRLTRLAEQTGELRADKRELTEALDAAMKAFEALSMTTSFLASGANWGTYDTMDSITGAVFGGSLIQTGSTTRDSSMFKQTKLDNARLAAQMAQAALDDLERELGDVREHVDPKRFNTSELGHDGWHQYFDIFVDNVFSDFKSLLRTKESRLKINSIREQVAQTIFALRTVRDEADRCIEEAEAERVRILESS